MLMSRTPARLGAEQALHAVGFQVSAAMLGGLVFPSLGVLFADSFDLEATAMLIVAAAGTLWLLHEVLLRVSSTTLSHDVKNPMPSGSYASSACIFDAA
jgi:hypothetical protein